MNKTILVCVYRDTTVLGYDKKNDNNLVYLEVAQDVALEYMKKHQLPKDWLDFIRRTIRWTFLICERLYCRYIPSLAQRKI